MCFKERDSYIELTLIFNHYCYDQRVLQEKDY